MNYQIVISAILLLTPIFLNIAQCQDCTPNFCDEAKVRCREVICEEGQVFHRRGGGLCGCCPMCSGEIIENKK